MMNRVIRLVLSILLVTLLLATPVFATTGSGSAAASSATVTTGDTVTVIFSVSGFETVNTLSVSYVVPEGLKLEKAEWLIEGTIRDVNLSKSQAVWTKNEDVDMTAKTDIFMLTFTVKEPTAQGNVTNTVEFMATVKHYSEVLGKVSASASIVTKPKVELPKLGVTLTLNETIDINFYVPAAVAPQASSYVVKKNGVVQDSSAYMVDVMNDNRIRIRYPMNADRMCDVLEVQAFDADGNAITQSRAMSIRDYGAIILNGNYSALDKHQIVTMLDYGALAQVANNSVPASGLANSIVTDAHRAAVQSYTWPTTTAPADSAIGSTSASGLSVSLTLNETIDMNFATSVNILDGDYTVIVKKNGVVLNEDSYTITKTADGRYRVRYCMNANKMCDVISVQIVNKDKSEAQYEARAMSIRNYAQLILDNEGFREIDKYLMIAMLDYGSFAQINYAKANGGNISTMDLANRYLTSDHRAFYQGYDWAN